jgi:hypothetical protein
MTTLMILEDTSYTLYGYQKKKLSPIENPNGQNLIIFLNTSQQYIQGQKVHNLSRRDQRLFLKSLKRHAHDLKDLHVYTAPYLFDIKIFLPPFAQETLEKWCTQFPTYQICSLPLDMLRAHLNNGGDSLSFLAITAPPHTWAFALNGKERIYFSYYATQKKPAEIQRALKEKLKEFLHTAPLAIPFNQIQTTCLKEVEKLLKQKRHIPLQEQKKRPIFRKILCALGAVFLFISALIVYIGALQTQKEAIHLQQKIDMRSQRTKPNALQQYLPLHTIIEEKRAEQKVEKSIIRLISQHTLRKWRVRQLSIPHDEKEWQMTIQLDSLSQRKRTIEKNTNHLRKIFAKTYTHLPLITHQEGGISLHFPLPPSNTASKDTHGP